MSRWTVKQERPRIAAGPFFLQEMGQKPTKGASVWL